MVLVGGPPADVPGWGGLEARRAELRRRCDFHLEPGRCAPTDQRREGSVSSGTTSRSCSRRPASPGSRWRTPGVPLRPPCPPARWSTTPGSTVAGRSVDGWVEVRAWRLARRSSLTRGHPARSGVAALRGRGRGERGLPAAGDPGEVGGPADVRLSLELAPDNPWPYADAVGDPEPVAGPAAPPRSSKAAPPPLCALRAPPSLASWTTRPRTPRPSRFARHRPSYTCPLRAPDRRRLRLVSSIWGVVRRDRPG